MLFFPERVAIAGLLVYLALLLVSPLQLMQPVSWNSLVYIALCYIAFLGGCFFVAHNRGATVPLQATSRFTPQVFWAIAGLGAVGMALRLTDKFMLRGASVADMALESRKLLGEENAGLIAALGGALYPLCYIPLIMWWARSPRIRLDARAKWMAILLASLPAIDALLLLSRSLMLVALSMMFVSAACVLHRGNAFHPRLLRPAAIGLVTSIVVSVLTFSSRLSQMDLDQVFSILNSGYGHVLAPTPHTVAMMSDPNSYIGSLLVEVIPLIQYYLHGIFEFGLLWDRPEQQDFTFGMQHFAPYFKVAGMLGLTSFSETRLEEAYYRIGVFTSFFGPLWVDFGWLGPAIMALLGALCSFCAQQARTGVLEVMPLYAYLTVVIFFMPVTNLIVGAQGMYILNALLLLWLLGRHSATASAVPGMMANRGYQR